jgi:CheY-like chemotaxis protein
MSRIEKPYVLVVDDDEATCTLIAAILRRDFAVESVNDALEAVEKLRVNNYAVVVLDLRMPQSDGFAVLDFVKQTKPGTLRNILIVTALLSPSEIERAKSYGICGIVSKPFDVDALLEAVRHCVGDGDGGRLSNVFCSSTPMILLLADLLRQRLG